MKIKRLYALNINSLKGVTEIDFERFTLFAITGPTGSGKSTLLDVISCALYGRTARLRNPNDLMSRYCGEAICEVEFEVKGELYRSSWTQKRARNRHDGKFQQAKMELSDVKSGKIIKTGSRDVPKFVEELSGLDFERFTQSMMLAQGSFDAFLKAKEADRSVLLEKITGTKIYADISKAIYEKYIFSQKDIEIDKKFLESITLIASEDLSKMQEVLSSNKELKILEDKKLKEINNELNWKQTLEKLTIENEKITQDFTDITKQKEDKKKDFIKLDLANRALNITPVFIQKRELKKGLDADKLSLENLTKETELLRVDISEYKKEHKKIYKEYEKAKVKLTLEREKLKSTRALQAKQREKQESLDEIKKSIDSKEKREKLLLNTLKDAKDLDSILDDIKRLTEILDEYKHNHQEIQKQVSKDAQDELKLQDRYRENEIILTLFLNYQNLTKREENELKDIEKNKDIDKDFKIKIEYLIQYIEETKRHIKTLWAKKEDELLIKKYEEDRVKLKEEEACFLCGSKEHPYLESNRNSFLDKTSKLLGESVFKLELKEKELKKLESKQTTVITKIENSIEVVKKLKSEVFTIKEKFKELSFNEKKSDEVSLKKEQESINIELEKIRERRKEKDDLLKHRDKLDLEIRTKESLLNETKLQIAKNQTRLDSLKVELSKERERCDEVNNSIKVLIRKQIDILNVANYDIYEIEITETFQKIEKEEKRASSKLQEIEIKYLENKKQVSILIEKISKTDNLIKSCEKEFINQLKLYGFRSEEEFTMVSMENEQREKLSKICKIIEDKFKETKALKNAVSKRLEEHRKEFYSDKTIEELDAKKELYQKRVDELQLSIGRDEKELELNKINQNRHKEKIVSLDRKKEAYKVWAKLQELIGSADGNKFAKFAQSITLDKLINLANEHLEALTNRYLLSRSQEEKQLLEMEIIDAYQGNIRRPVSTLSGGESFIVSLALALGLSNLASQKIAIDSLFLDEGFGTLDEESLDIALDALSLLQNRGKMIGIISHVEALKERIPSQIKVVSKGDGTSRVIT